MANYGHGVRPPLKTHPDLPTDLPYVSVFVGESILPAQFFGARRSSAELEPVQRLMSAVLEDAVRCFERNQKSRTASRRRAFLEAEQWLFKDSRGAGLFSFESVCEVLDTDPDRLRRALSRWHETSVAGETMTRLTRRSAVHSNKERIS